MRIAVLADTHDWLPLHVSHEIAGADEIWHLGDVTDEAVLDALRTSGRPVHVVRGNCDSHADWPWVLDLEREGCRARLIHIPPLMPPPVAVTPALGVAAAELPALPVERADAGPIIEAGRPLSVETSRRGSGGRED